jgi:hypothetical protein
MPIATSDANMIRLIDILKEARIIRFKEEFYETVGIDRQGVRAVRLGKQRFTLQQVEKAVEAYNVRPDWIFGVSQSVFKTKLIPKALSSLHLSPEEAAPK